MSIVQVGTIDGRVKLLADGRALDIATASDGQYGPDPLSVFGAWAQFSEWASSVVLSEAESVAFEPRDLGTPVPRPSQIFAIGLNYADHAAESKMDLPEHPVVFTKFGSSLAGADIDVVLTGDRVDWEAELIAVIGEGGRDIPADRAWDHVAGLAVSQDISDRTVQQRGNPAQFSLGKSFAGYAPVGPITAVGDLPEGSDRNALRITSVLTDTDGSSRVLQVGTTADMIFSVEQIVHRLSQVVELRPGDVHAEGGPVARDQSEVGPVADAHLQHAAPD